MPLEETRREKRKVRLYMFGKIPEIVGVIRTRNIAIFSANKKVLRISKNRFGTFCDKMWETQVSGVRKRE